VIPLNLTGTQAAATVGKADFSTYIGQIPTRYKDHFLLHHRDQVRVNPFMGTNFLFLNMNVAPFNDVRVRRAINFALDRSAIVKSEGGSIAGNPTCQVLPPGMPGYRPYCPYTRNPGVPSRWHGPDVAKAKRLVAASGTKGTNVTVWSTVGPQPEQRATVATLKRLGYRASLRLLAASTYYTYTNDSRNRAQIISGGWSTDYPTANDFLGKLTCGYFIPGDGLNTTNASEHCDRAFDAQVGRAASLETRAPQTAHALWAQLDRHITDLAIWLPTITPNAIDLVSRRVANHYSYHPVWGVLLDQLRVD
jgi:peptide/nickel transport system substrate-binding protein